jgi:microcystin degradation protein MlrC
VSRYRIAAAQIQHETNVFSSVRTDMAAFRRSGLKFGAEIEVEQGTNSAFGGFFTAAERHDIELLPILSVWVTPSGIVTADAISELISYLTAQLTALQPDGVAISLHGAMVSEADRDGDGWILEQVRDAVGWDIPIVCELDLHANISARMIEAADILVGYDTYPHVDMAERGAEVIDLLVRMLRGEINPAMAMVKPPMLPTSQRMMTAHDPMATIMRRAHEIESDPRVLNVTFAGGFPPSDVEEGGVSCVVTTDGDLAAAIDYADELARLAWSVRDGFLGGVSTFEDAAEAIAALPGQPEKPLLIVDIADSIWSGSSGDSVELVRFFLDQEVARAAVAPVVDPGVVALAQEAGADAEIDVELGGKSDDLHGPSLPCRARVLSLTEGRYVNSGPMMTGLQVDMGPTAVLAIGDPAVRVVVTSFPDAPIDPAVFTSNGIDVASTRVLGLKGKGHFRAAFEPITSEVILVEGPGVTGSDLTRLPLRHTRRPIWPLDDVDFG